MIVSEIEISYKPTKIDSEPITNSKQAEELLRKFWDELIDYRESVYILLLNRKHDPIGIRQVSTGTLSGCMMPVSQILAIALKANANSFIVAHNHPSGNLKPSHSDDRICKQLKQAGDIVECKLLDFMILTSESYMSYMDESNINIL